MRQTILSLTFLLLTFCLWAKNEMEDGAIERVKTVPVSSLDRDLPRVTLVRQSNGKSTNATNAPGIR